MTKTRALAALAVVVLAVAVVVVGRGGAAPIQTSSGNTPDGAQIVGQMTIEGIGGAIDLRGVSFGVTSGPQTSGRPAPGSISPLSVVKDVDKASAQILRIALEPLPARTVRIDIYKPDSSEVGTSVTITQPRLTSVSIAHQGRSGERVLETLSWDVSASQVTVTADGASVCWDSTRGRTC